MWDRKIIKAWAKQDLAGGRYRKALIVTWVIGIIGGMIPLMQFMVVRSIWFDSFCRVHGSSAG